MHRLSLDRWLVQRDSRRKRSLQQPPTLRPGTEVSRCHTDVPLKNLQMMPLKMTFFFLSDIFFVPYLNSPA
ncbi:hypothetical protein CEXT_671311 [Caerostris extrusa]|uniref:Uncharacterized protein n=1 Tax=Caerostris extrusa TaxID=172846 RepID=A0AAV4NK45_CAEEX|nr:hypothetical protein CEXT_671311 [Caerostris extrusa]